MVKREHFVNKIRELGYSFKLQQKRTYLYRHTNGTHFIPVPKADLLEDDFVICSLRQAGQSEAEIRSFLATTKT
ncbi:MAG: hypothetical protein ABFD76_16615 [Smithella sp.]